MRVVLLGYGKMGRTTEKIAQERGHAVVASTHRDTPLETLPLCDVAIDFSAAEAVPMHAAWAFQAKIPLVVGTTGWEAHAPHIRAQVEAQGTALLAAPNFSLGVALYLMLLEQLARSPLSASYQMAGQEQHHRDKRDAPSGTAKAIQALFPHEVPFSALRCGTLCGTHTLICDSPYDTLTFTHHAKNREGFALGAVQAAEWILGKQGYFTLRDLFL